MRTLTDEEWQEFKRQMRNLGIPFKQEERTVVQQLTWTNLFEDLKQYGSTAATEEARKKSIHRLAASGAKRAAILKDWTEEYGRSRKVGDKVLLLDTAWNKGITYDDPRFILDCLQELIVEGINSGRLRTNQPRRVSGSFYAKSGKNCFYPKGQAYLVIPPDGFDFEHSLGEVQKMLKEKQTN